VVGILFRPPAGPLLTTTDPVALVSSSQPLPTAPTGPVQRIMTGVTYDQRELAQILRAWLLPLAAGVDDRGRLVNNACRLAEDDSGLTRAADLAARLGVSPRSLERLVRSQIGMTPKWLSNAGGSSTRRRPCLARPTLTSPRWRQDSSTPITRTSPGSTAACSVSRRKSPSSGPGSKPRTQITTPASQRQDCPNLTA
jgi:hypothetical protein